MIRDRNIDWLRQIRRIPAHRFFGDAVVASTITTLAALIGFDEGAPEHLEVSSFGYGGISIGATGDNMSVLDLEHPCQWNPQQEIGVRCLWTTNGSVDTADTVTWTVTYDQADEGEALGAATTALDTVIVVQSPTATTLLLRRSGRGIINANTFDFTSRAGALGWTVDCAYTGFSTNEIVFLGLEIDYIPLLCANAEEDLDVFSVRAASA